MSATIALKTSDSALGESFSPDPAVALVRRARAFSKGKSFDGALSVHLAHALYKSGRRGEAYRWAQSVIDRPELTPAALRVLVLIENISYSRKTLRRVQAVLKDEPNSQDAQVAEILLLVRLQQMQKAKTRLEKLPKLKDKELQAQVLEARLKIELATESNDNELLVTAEEALRSAPKSNRVLGLMVETLIRVNKLERAKSFALALAKRKPSDVDPYSLLHRIQKKRGKTRNLPSLKARSALLKKSMRKIEKTAELREEVIRAVRQAEYSSVSASALQAVRRESPALSLPVDFAIGRLGSRGQAQAARERILAACAVHLKTILLNRRGSDWVSVTTNPYGQLERAEVPLSAADPSRCKTRRLKRR